MSAKLCFRIAAVIFVLFAAGHTFGFLGFQPSTPEGLAVWKSMNDVHFEVSGSTFSYGGFYMGFGLSATCAMLFQSFVCWIAGGLVSVAPGAARALAWAFCLLQITAFALSLIYFSIAPAVFSCALAALFAWAAIKSQSADAKKGEPEGPPLVVKSSARS